MAIDSDKITHLKGGALVAAFAAVLGFAIMVTSGMHPVSLGIISASVCAALAIEGAQWFENRHGAQVQRDVSAADAAVTMLPGLVLAAAVELAARTWVN